MILVSEYFPSRKKKSKCTSPHVMRQKYPLQISCVICDFPPGKYLETLCSMPIIFIEGRMWSHQSLFFFAYVLIGKLQCKEIK